GGAGIALRFTKKCKVLANKVHDISSGGFSGYGPVSGIYIQGIYELPNSPSENLVANNVIYSLYRWGFGAAVVGILYNSGYGDKIVFNSVLMNGFLGYNAFGA